MENFFETSSITLRIYVNRFSILSKNIFKNINVEIDDDEKNINLRSLQIAKKYPLDNLSKCVLLGLFNYLSPKYFCPERKCQLTKKYSQPIL